MFENNDAPISLNEYPYHIVPFISDYGFKVAFTEDTLFTRKAIQLLIRSDIPIDKLTMERNEINGIALEGRSGTYDVICKDEHNFRNASR